MKKIQIYTYKHSNYGAVLQAYALQKYLKNTFEVDVKVVDFTTDAHLKSDRLIKSTGGIIERIVISLSNILHSSELKRRIRRTISFKEKYYDQTKRYVSVVDLINNNPSADIYITGSDQVFNPNSIYMPVYYLGFKKGNGIKVAYAPSFGISNFTPDVTEKIQPYIDDFDFISCRETVGADYLSSIVGRKVPVVCDPTLLLTLEEWGEIAKQPSISQKYILVYEINGGDKIIKLAKKISIETGLPIICITSKTYKNYKVLKQVYDAGPAEFVGWFKDADYVVTDSFHGTIFSWIFRKMFFYFLAYEATSSRARTLLKHLECENRLVTINDLHDFKMQNYVECKRVTPDFIRESKIFINTFINNYHE